MNLSELPQEWLHRALSATWFTIGATPINFPRILGLIVILVAIWWVARTTERLIIKLATASGNKSLSASAIYAFSRISRYAVWFVGSIVGLNFIGFDLSSLALMGGALGVGIGFGLQNIFSNLVSGIIMPDRAYAESG